MEGRGRALDNVFAERQRRTLKQEEVYLHDDQTPREAMQELAGFLLRYMSSVGIGHSVIGHQRRCRSAKERHTSL